MAQQPNAVVEGFVGSLLLLVAALTLCFGVLVLGPRVGGGFTPLVTAAPLVRKAVVRPTPKARPVADNAAVADGAALQPVPAAVPTGTDGATGSAADPNDDPRVERAIHLIDNGDVAAAVPLLESVLKDDPRNEQALVELGMVNLLDLKRPEQATSYLQRAMVVNPANEIVMSELVSLFEEQGRLGEGVDFFKSIQSGEASPAVAYGIGQLLTLAGRDDEAVDYLEKATKDEGKQVEALRDLGEAYARTGDSEKAVQSFSQAIDDQESEIQDKAARGLPVKFAEERLAYTKIDAARELVHLGELDQAQALLEEVRAFMPTDESVAELEKSISRDGAG